MKLTVIPLAIFLILALIFFRGLSLDPKTIPSAKIGSQVPEFSLPLLNENGNYSNKELNGQFTLLCVWASWCDACKSETAFLAELAKKGVHLIGLNYKDVPTDANQWLRVWGNPFAHILSDQNGKVAIDLGVYGAPETFLISPEGKILYRHIGVLTQDDWDRQFVPLMHAGRI